MTKQYSSIFVDLDDTIWDFSANSHAALEQTYDALQLSRYFPRYDEFAALYYERNRRLWEQYHHALITRDYLIIERFAYVLRHYGVEDPADRLAGTMNSYYLDTLACQTRLVPHATEMLAYLRDRGYRLYILSNGFKEVQARKLQAAGIDEYFGRIVLSDEIGVTKPDARIFDYALEVTQSAAGTTLMIGDNYDADIMGAARAGWGQIYYDRNNRGVDGEQPQHTIHDLREVMEIL